MDKYSTVHMKYKNKVYRAPHTHTHTHHTNKMKTNFWASGGTQIDKRIEKKKKERNKTNV
jgi:hypothetical protein